MNSAVGVTFAGAVTQKVSFASDVWLIGIGCIGAATARVAISSDPNVTASALITPTSTGLDTNVIAFIGGGFIAEIPAVGIPSGVEIFCAASVATTLLLFLADIQPLIE